MKCLNAVDWACLQSLDHSVLLRAVLFYAELGPGVFCSLLMTAWCLLFILESMFYWKYQRFNVTIVRESYNKNWTHITHVQYMYRELQLPAVPRSSHTLLENGSEKCMCCRRDKKRTQTGLFSFSLKYHANALPLTWKVSSRLQSRINIMNFNFFIR